MFEREKINKLEDFFLDLNRRSSRSVYVYRFTGYDEEISEFIKKYYNIALSRGVILEEKIPNPDGHQIAYYEEIIGMDFQLSIGFLGDSLKKWIPSIGREQQMALTTAIYDSLEEFRAAGKNANMLKNIYIKFMCWLYYKFQRILNLIGANQLPKIIYEGTISQYELSILSVIARAGCDVVMLQHGGEQAYAEVDPSFRLSEKWTVPKETAFGHMDYLEKIRIEIEETLKIEKLYGELPRLQRCTNAWIEGKGLSDILKEPCQRGEDSDLFYNCFIKINGVEDKSLYENDLFRFSQELVASNRTALILENGVDKPSPEEISGIRRGNYRNTEEMLLGLSANISYSRNDEIKKLMKKSFLDVLFKEADSENMNLNRLMGKAVYMLCWLKRYEEQLFSGFDQKKTACLIYMGNCEDDTEGMFLRFLAALPVDILILNPSLSGDCKIEDELLYEINHLGSMNLSGFPKDSGAVMMGTTAYHAERELDELMYRDTGLYRNRQYTEASTINLQTMYEEIWILWDQELKYRPNFATTSDRVNIPAIYAKVCGVKDGQVSAYWSKLGELMTEDTFLIKELPFISPTAENPMKSSATEFFKNGKLQKKKIREHPKYRYSVLREETQEHIFEKLHMLIDEKIIKGTFENGTEYTIVSTVLNLPKEILRMIQRFDFTGKNPKLVLVNTSEKPLSLEDTILVSFLNLVGFDVVFFVPTGYQTIEKYLNKRLMAEHQIGEYLYDLQVPDLAHKLSTARPKSWREKIFKRGK